MAPCLPGAEITETGDDGSYRGTFSVRLGGFSLFVRALWDRIRRAFGRR